MSESSKFKVGDRIAIYLANGRFVATVQGHREGDVLSVRIESGMHKGYTWVAHEKMCRRIIKPIRQAMVYVNEYRNDSGVIWLGAAFSSMEYATAAAKDDPWFLRTREFVEVKSKKESKN